jgi:agmatine deiminase
MHRRHVLTTALAAGLGGGRARAGGARFFVPAEDARHEATLMQWPASRAVHDDADHLAAVQATILRLANAIAAFEPVILLAAADHHAAIRPRVAGAVALWDIPTEDLWARDAGPIVVTDGRGARAVRHIRFNGWGGRQIHGHDGQIAARMAARLGFPILPSPLTGEGGGVEQDGHGLLIAHESSWVHSNRNPGMTRDAVAEALLDAYGADRIVWAPGLRDRDITDYHIDSLARLTGPGRVLMTLPRAPDPEDPFHAAALATEAALRAAGLSVEVIADPDRPRIRSADFVAAYANFYLCNGAVIAAQFGDRAADAAAAAALSRHFPGREVVTLNVDPLGEIGGGIHCATREIPA